MPRPTDINPKTGKRYDFVDEKIKAQAATEETRSIKSQINLLERQRAALMSRTSLLAYTKFTMPDPEAPNDVKRSRYEDELFHRAIATALEDVERGETPQLIFVMPPRHGKTEMATKRMAAWCSGRHPEWDVVVASYSDTMANDMGADTRAILTSPQHLQVFPGYKLRRGGTAKDNIQTVVGGRLVFVGRGGALTGRGMNIGLGDDLFKDHEEARSQATRDAAWNWFTKVFMTRRMGLKLVILTMTRWHSDDVIGRLTDPENPHYNSIEAKKWKIIRLPAIAEPDDPLGRKLGEALWPRRYDIDFLESQQRLDPLGFAALYQQRPTVADGTYFRRENIRYYDDLPDDLRWYAASDHAVGTKQRNDPSCFLKGGMDRQGNVFLHKDCFWQRAKTDFAVEAMLTMAGGDAKPLLWWAESGHISKSIGPFLFKRMGETSTFINIRETPTIGDKVQRAQSAMAMVSVGRVYFPRSALWTERAINELLAFDNGNHDDFVDALAILCQGLRSMFGVGAVEATPQKPEPKFGTLDWVKRHDRWRKEREERTASGGF